MIKSFKSPQFKDFKTKEALMKAQRYIYLKVKAELFPNKLTSEEIKEILNNDFQEQLEITPPIEGIFYPEEEIKRIRSLPKEQRKEALRIFKDKLSCQREALAACTHFLERIIEINPNVSQEDLISWVEKFGANYGFNEKHKNIFLQIIERYFETRRKILEIRNQFPDNYKLVKELTGVTLNRDEYLDVSVGPMAIEIYVELPTIQRMYNNISRLPLVFIPDGFANRYGKVPYIVVAVRPFSHSLSKKLDTYSLLKGLSKIPGMSKILDYIRNEEEEVRKHENQHLKNAFGRYLFENKRPFTWVYFHYYVIENDTDKKKEFLKYFFQGIRCVALEDVKDEIFAYLRYLSLSDLRNRLNDLFFIHDNGPYDFVSFYLSRYEPEKFKNDQLFQEMGRKMLVEEYREIIEKAFNSLVELTEKGKYSAQISIYLLIDKPLEDWPKTVKRLLEYKL